MSNRGGYALLAAGVVLLGGVIWWKRAPSVPPLPPLPPRSTDGARALESAQRAIEALRPAEGTDPDPAVQALLARLGRFGALGADDLAEAEAQARGLEAALPPLLDILGSPPPPDAPKPSHAATPAEQRLRRVDAARLLGAIGDSRAIPALGRMLDSPIADPFVQEAAAEALGKIGDRAGLVPLLSFLAEDRVKDWRATIAAAIAALRLGAPMGGDELMTVLNDWNPAMAKRPRVFDRERAVHTALVPIAGRVVAEYDAYMLPPQLQEAGKAWTQWWEKYRTAPFPIPEGVRSTPGLVDALLQPHLPFYDDTSFFYRKRAQDVMAGLGDEAVPYLLELLRHEDSKRRQLAANALGHTDARDHALPLRHLLAAWGVETFPLAQAEIVKAIRRLRPSEALASEIERVVAEAAAHPDLTVRNGATAVPIPK